ncbi:putative secreted protein [Chryseobacterium ginsenosidimutans]|uniref:SIMPL domain-containing protein n=1 Tax=Chryseobacterium ginsenosidimutans TaxID=687846 RepID=UPI002787C712|nr:SIMPL domain-containing protein [Chryseobacterium ginsenosidimutans]MDQ0593540.1 putative secreted protein [Chryseobacterium ginsenosidimutans]
MKNITLLAAALFFQLSFSQMSGNINYRNQVQYTDNNISVAIPVVDDNIISVKGLANIKAEQYIAIFSVTQVGENADEVNELIDKRINTSMAQIKLTKGVETYVDMISFVPVYQYNVEKKIFSKKTYNEVPAGFELKKNLHIKFTDPTQLNAFISILSKNEIYDLVRVDYFSSTIESIRKELMNKAKLALQEKVKNFEAILGESFATAKKNVNDGFRVTLPTEMYKSYEAYNSSSLALTKFTNVNQVNKATTSYYQPILDKEFDFVINPVIHEPVIQVMYEIKLTINREKEKEKKTETKEINNYILVTPTGEVKNLNLLAKP